MKPIPTLTKIKLKNFARSCKINKKKEQFDSIHFEFGSVESNHQKFKKNGKFKKFKFVWRIFFFIFNLVRIKFEITPENL